MGATSRLGGPTVYGEVPPAVSEAQPAEPATEPEAQPEEPVTEPEPEPEPEPEVQPETPAAGGRERPAWFDKP